MLEDPNLRVEVLLNGVVPVEMVLREVQEHGDLGREPVAVLELKARGLADHRRRRRKRAGVGAHRGTDVAGDGDRPPGGAVDLSDQLDCGRLSVGPGHRAELVRNQAPPDLELSEHLDSARTGVADHLGVGRHARALDQRSRGLRSGEKLRSIRLQVNFDAHLRKPLGLRPSLGGAAAVAAGNAGGGLGAPEGERRRHARPCQPDDEVRRRRERRPLLHIEERRIAAAPPTPRRFAGTA